MNYSQSKQICMLLHDLLSMTVDQRLCVAARLAAEAKDRRKRASMQKASDISWGATTSEWDYINSLQGISDILQQGDEKVEKRLSLFLDDRESQEIPLKVVFFVQEYSLWASLRSVYNYFTALDACDIDIVYVYAKGYLPEKGKEENMAAFRENGYPVSDMGSYDLSEMSPDIVFYLKPYKNANGAPLKYYIDEVSKHIPYTVFISYCLDVQGGEILQKYFYALPMFFHAWKMLAYSAYYAKQLKRYSYCDAENIIELGHPKFDGIYDAMKDGAFRRPEWDEFVAGRPVVFWNTHFSVENNKGVGTFFVHKDAMFEYFRNHKDTVLLWRPHPYFWETVVRDPRFSKEKLAALLEELENMGNVIVDRDGDYRYAFATADMLVSDAATFLVEFAITGKPAFYTPKIGGEFIINKSYLEGMEVYSDNSSLFDFMESVDKDDVAGVVRRQFYEDQFGVCDGQNGNRIGAYLMEAMESDCEYRVRILLGLENGGEV